MGVNKVEEFFDILEDYYSQYGGKANLQNRFGEDGTMNPIYVVCYKCNNSKNYKCYFGINSDNIKCKSSNDYDEWANVSCLAEVSDVELQYILFAFIKKFNVCRVDDITNENGMCNVSGGVTFYSNKEKFPPIVIYVDKDLDNEYLLNQQCAGVRHNGLYPKDVKTCCFEYTVCPKSYTEMLHFFVNSLKDLPIYDAHKHSYQEYKKLLDDSDTMDRVRFVRNLIEEKD